MKKFEPVLFLLAFFMSPSAWSAPWSSTADEIQIAGGDEFTCRLQNGNVRCWGASYYGRQDVPLGLKDVRAIYAGDTSGCAVMDEETRCWGRGIGYLEGVNLGNSKTLKKLAMGSGHVCALSFNGEVKCFGRDALQPPADLGKVADISSKASYVCALVEGSPRCWGEDVTGQVNDVPTQLRGVKSIHTGEYTVCAQLELGVECWGYVEYFDATISQAELKLATRVSLGARGSCFFILGKWKCIGDGNSKIEKQPAESIYADVLEVMGGHACYWSDGNLRCWGYNDKGQAVPIFDPINPRLLSIGLAQTCVVAENGLQCRGVRPLAHQERREIKALTASSTHSCVAVAQAGEDRVNCFREDFNHEFSVGGTVSKLKSGNDFLSCALMSTGELKCFNQEGIERSRPPSDLGGVVDFMIGYQRSVCALTVVGTIRCWNERSEEIRSPFGDVKGVRKFSSHGTSFCAVTDKEIVCENPGFSRPMVGVSELVNSFGSFCAVAQGKVECWGTSGSHREPLVAPTDLVNPRQLAIGFEHACVITDQGVRCWGKGLAGELYRQ